MPHLRGEGCGWEAVNKRFLSTSRLKNPKNAQFVDWRERNPELPKRIKQSSWEMMGISVETKQESSG